MAKGQLSHYLSLKRSDIEKLPKCNKIEVLEKLIHFHNKKYFLDNEPIISDEEFDKLTIMLTKLNPNSEVLYEIIGEIGDVHHSTRMLSIEKKYTYENIKKWINDIDDNQFIVEPKYDGMAARFSKGVLATRGNGQIGENITERFKYLNIIGKLNPNADVDGEVIIPITYFNKNLSKVYKNPRNAVVGIVKAKRLNKQAIKALKDKGVHFVIYDKASSYKVTKKELLNTNRFEEILEKILQIDYPLDGMVIKVSNLNLRKKLGATAHHYRWQIAYKLPAERKWTEVIEIKDQVGRTGRITGVAIVKPINLSGATITNVTLHNYKYAYDSKIGKGSKVEIMRSGEVIPFITKIIPAQFPHYYSRTIKKLHCPICKSKLEVSNKYLKCNNIKCPARLSLSIEYFFKTLGAEELGLKTVERFINEFKTKNILDFYKLDANKIAVLDGFGSKSASNITNNISRTLTANITPEQLLQAIGLREIGPSTSKWIINHYGFNNLNKLKMEDLQDIDGVGPIKAKHFVEDIKNNWWIIKGLLKLKLTFKKEKTTKKLQNKSFCITGKKETYSRNDLIKLISLNGGTYKSSITKDLDYLIAGDNAGSKLKKAQDLKIKIISETEFIKMID